MCGVVTQNSRDDKCCERCGYIILRDIFLTQHAMPKKAVDCDVYHYQYVLKVKLGQLLHKIPILKYILYNSCVNFSFSGSEHFTSACQSNF